MSYVGMLATALVLTCIAQLDETARAAAQAVVVPIMQNAEQTHERAWFTGIVPRSFVSPDRADEVSDRPILFRK